MRGRTLDKAFVILDEAQNATVAQMKMFSDAHGQIGHVHRHRRRLPGGLPRKQESGLRFAKRVLKGVEGLSFVELTGSRCGAPRLGQAGHSSL